MKKLSIGLAITCTLLSAATRAQQSASLQTLYRCPVLQAASKEDRDRVRDEVTAALIKSFDAAIGPESNQLYEPKVLARVAARRVDEQRMAELADVSGCAALLDQHSGCSAYFNSETGNPLSVFTGMKRRAPLRKQFEEAIARLPVAEMRHAAQSCIKRTSSHE